MAESPGLAVRRGALARPSPGANDLPVVWTTGLAGGNPWAVPFLPPSLLRPGAPHDSFFALGPVATIMKRLAVVGSGISGLAVAHALAGEARVSLFEAGSHFGGHTHTVDVTLNGVTHGVDTGFLVFNHRTYPELVRLFGELQVQTAPSEMSFSVQVPAAPGQRRLEWSGNNLNSVFTQRSNLLRPEFLRMLADLLRFNKLATAIAARNQPGEQPGEQHSNQHGNQHSRQHSRQHSNPGAELAEPIGEFLVRHRFSAAFTNWYLLPMIGCIWSCPTDQMLQFPVGTMIRFCHNHGLLQVADRPQWHTVVGGARNYVRKMLPSVSDKRLNTPVRSVRRLPGAGVALATDQGTEIFDEVVLACHSDQSLALLADATAVERAVLGAVRYQPNRTVLHTDTAVLPRQPRAWAAWNYARAAQQGREQAAVCLHYLINRLQPLPWPQPVLVSLNPDPAHPPDPAKVLHSFDVSHPVFDRAAVHAQGLLPQIQGRQGVWFCGAWTRYGFHEDGLLSAQAVVRGWRSSNHQAAAALPLRAA